MRANLKAEGCREPLVVWSTSAGPILLDGHTRYDLCTQEGIPFQTIAASNVRTRQEAMSWIINNQLGRRNLTPEQTSYLRGKRYNLEKKQGERNDLTSAHFEQKSDTAESLAEEYKISRATIVRDGQFAAAVDTLAANVGKPVQAESSQ